MLNNKKIFYLVISITLIMIIVSTIMGFKIITDLNAQKKDSAPLGTATAGDAGLVEQVGRHLVLPYEQPKIVTIANVEDLKKSQPFFNQAKNGDKLLVYSNRVILYNPELDKIIDIAAIRIDVSPAPIPITD